MLIEASNSSFLDGSAPSKKRDFRLDVIRVVAILLVMLIHSFEACYGDAAWKDSHSIAFSLSFCLGRLGVPMFFMLTGYLVLAKDYSTEGALSGFYRQSWTSLLTTILFWTVVYGILFVAAGQASVLDVVKWVLFLEDVPAGLWWFVPAVVSLYSAIPFVSRALNGLSPRALIVPAMFVLAYGFIVPTLSRCAPVLGWGVSSSVNVGYLFSPYGAYILLGYALRRFGWGRWACQARPFVVLALAVSIAVGTALAWHGVKLWYDTLPVAIGGVSLFIFLFGFIPVNEEVPGRVRRTLTWASKVSFAAYFLELVPLRVMAWQGILPDPCVTMACIIFFVLLVILGAVLGVLWVATSRLPRLRKLVFHAR